MKKRKFRVWDGKEMHYTENESSKWDGQYYLDIGGTLYIDKDGHLFSTHHICTEFTGLKDKNGVEIYEGDVLQCNHYYASRRWWSTLKEAAEFEAQMEEQRNNIEQLKFEVYFNDASFNCGYNKGLSDFIRGYKNSGQHNNGEWEERFWDFEVIGNIYKNKDLIS